ncbi:9447_t:CDS:2 [Funneliformis caledonium]|uniref:9447_t:CDS:1 n=1 Tax=Funneliformis caledonium TaxID=1117310 RepID=A0A9N9BC31_9GLOM|nr:9447_t:CDS:2 [Funneliformis caledonium]
MSEISERGSPSSKRVRFLDDSSNFIDPFNNPFLEESENSGIEKLKKDLQRLERERDEKKLLFDNLKKSHSLRDIIDKENVDENVTMTQDEFQEHMIQDMIQASKEREYEEILNAYRLTGITIFSVKGNRTGIRFETFYRAKYREPYYIILEQDQENDQLSVFRHTIPHFIPIDELEATYLNKDLRKFANIIGENLQAFVTRREELNTLLESGKAIEPKANHAYSVIEFTIPLKDSTALVEASLTYDDLKSSNPTNAVIFLTKEDPESSEKRRQRLQRREQEFLQRNLVEAFDIVFGEVEEIDM